MMYHLNEEVNQKVNKNKKNSSNSLVFGRWPQPKKKNLRAVAEKEKLGEIVEDDADAFVAERVSEAVLVRVVDPLGNPHHRRNLGIFGLVLEGPGNSGGWVRGHDRRQKLVKLGQVAILGTVFS